ncbi:MAG: sulfurtransferase TusA family protein [Cyanobium sp. MAG_237]|nr:sulfurtransferase TusA family protein [Cyanobium sp. MAG_237]
MSASWADGNPDAQLDLRGIACPLNFIRTKLALERLVPGQILQVDLDRGEPQQQVTQGLESSGHGVICCEHPEQQGAVRLLVRC